MRDGLLLSDLSKAVNNNDLALNYYGWGIWKDSGDLNTGNNESGIQMAVQYSDFYSSRVFKWQINISLVL